MLCVMCYLCICVCDICMLCDIDRTGGSNDIDRAGGSNETDRVGGPNDTELEGSAEIHRPEGHIVALSGVCVVCGILGNSLRIYAYRVV